MILFVKNKHKMSKSNDSSRSQKLKPKSKKLLVKSLGLITELKSEINSILKTTDNPGKFLWSSL